MNSLTMEKLILEELIKLNKLINNIVNKDDDFRLLMESQECKHQFYKVDSHLYRNKYACLSDNLQPFDEVNASNVLCRRKGY